MDNTILYLKIFNKYFGLIHVQLVAKGNNKIP